MELSATDTNFIAELCPYKDMTIKFMLVCLIQVHYRNHCAKHSMLKKMVVQMEAERVRTWARAIIIGYVGFISFLLFVISEAEIWLLTFGV